MGNIIALKNTISQPYLSLIDYHRDVANMKATCKKHTPEWLIYYTSIKNRQDVTPELTFTPLDGDLITIPSYLRSEGGIQDWFIFGNGVINQHTQNELAFSGFNARFTFNEESSNGKTKNISAISILKTQYPKNIIDKIQYNPTKPKIWEVEIVPGTPGEVYLNTYTPKTFEVYAKEDVSRFGLLFETLVNNIFNNNAVRTDFFISYLAHTVQKLGTKKGFMIHLTTTPGAGKSIIGTLMSQIVDTCEDLSPRELASEFSPSSSGDCLKIIDEMDPVGEKRAKIENAIKRLITEKTITIIKKGYDAIIEPSFCSLLSFSNKDDCIKLYENQRRICAFINMKPSSEHVHRDVITGLVNYINTPSMTGAIHEYFNTYDISNFNHQTFISDNDNVSFIQNTMTDVEFAFNHICTQSGFLDRYPKGFTLIEAIDKMILSGVGKNVTPKMLGKTLRGLGFVDKTCRLSKTTYTKRFDSPKYRKIILAQLSQ